MLCFEVSVNGEIICLAGVGSHGVLSAILSWVHTNTDTLNVPDSELETSESYLSVGGLVNKEHLNWLPGTFSVQIDDTITIRLVDSEVADEPLRRGEDTNPLEVRRNRYEFYKTLKKEFETDGVLLPEEEADSEVASSLRKQLYEELKKDLGY